MALKRTNHMPTLPTPQKKKEKKKFSRSLCNSQHLFKIILEISPSVFLSYRQETYRKHKVPLKHYLSMIQLYIYSLRDIHTQTLAHDNS